LSFLYSKKLYKVKKSAEILVARGIRQYSTFNGYIEEQGWQDIAATRWEEEKALGDRFDSLV